MVLLRENWCWSLLENGQLVLHHCCKTSLQKRCYFFAFFRWPKASEKRARSARHETCATGKGTLRSSEINTWSAGYCKTGWRAMLRVLPPTTRPCLAAIKVVAGCGKLLEKLESNKICTCCAFYRPKANLFCSKWRNSRVWRDCHVHLSNSIHSIHTTCHNLICCNIFLLVFFINLKE